MGFQLISPQVGALIHDDPRKLRTVNRGAPMRESIVDYAGLGLGYARAGACLVLGRPVRVTRCPQVAGLGLG